ncbi:Single-stranded DNA-binding protein WHY1, chloroplastic [Capsicum chinense]|nr:Single-stranded DNA-binding protein WHY1, chloroplastic [Capsicum chinense]
MEQSGAFKLSREGMVMLQFAPAAGVRQYDWSRKQVFSLSVTEIGSIISLGAKDSCEFFHDPNKGRSDEGRVRKVLKVEPLPDGSGHFFNLSVQNKLINLDENIYIPVTKAEFAVLVSAFNVGTLLQIPSSLKIPVAQTMLIQDQVPNLNGIDSSDELDYVACAMIGGQDALLALGSTFCTSLFDLCPPAILQRSSNRR